MEIMSCISWNFVKLLHWIYYGMNCIGAVLFIGMYKIDTFLFRRMCEIRTVFWNFMKKLFYEIHTAINWIGAVLFWMCEIGTVLWNFIKKLFYGIYTGINWIGAVLYSIYKRGTFLLHCLYELRMKNNDDVNLHKVWTDFDREEYVNKRLSARRKAGLFRNIFNRFRNTLIEKFQRCGKTKTHPFFKETNELKTFNVDDLQGGTISLKIYHLQENNRVMINEFIVSSIRVKIFLKKYPQIQNLMPHSQGILKEINYSARAMIILLRFITGNPYYIRKAEVAMETYELAEDHRVHPLRDKCDNFLYSFMDNSFIKEKWCYFAFTYLTDFYNVDIPLDPLKPNMDSVFNTDITNEITVTAVDGSLTIKGIQLKFNADAEQHNAELKTFIKVNSPANTYENEVNVNMKPSFFIKFPEDIIIQEDQSVNISVTIENIKPKFCFTSLNPDPYFTQKRIDKEFNVALKSTRRNTEKKSVLFVEKIFLKITNEINVFEILCSDPVFVIYVIILLFNFL